jgi:hypothetical protein
VALNIKISQFFSTIKQSAYSNVPGKIWSEKLMAMNLFWQDKIGLVVGHVNLPKWNNIH